MPTEELNTASPLKVEAEEVRVETLKVVAVRELAEREFVEREANPEAAPKLVIFQVLEVTSMVLPSFPKVILPVADKFPPVDIPCAKSPNEAETPEPICGGEFIVGPGT